MAVLAAGTAWAQGPGQFATTLEQAESFAPPVQMGGPSVQEAQYGAEYCPPEGMYPGATGYPPQGGYGGEVPFAPWPGVSPFDHRFDQVTPVNGLWTRFTNDSPRRYHGGIDWMFLWYRRPGGAGLEPDKQVGFPVRLADRGNGLQPNEDEFQDRLLDGQGVFPATPGVLGAGTFSPRQPINSPERIVRWDFFQDDFDKNGFQLNWGFVEADDSGWDVSGFYGGKANEEMDIPIRPVHGGVTTLNGTSGDVSLVVNRVRTVDGVLSQVPLLFVTQIDITYQAQAWGAQVDWMTTPILGRGSNKLRGTIGGRYMGVHEQFNFHGLDKRPAETPLETDPSTGSTFRVVTPREQQALDSGFGGNYIGDTFVRTHVNTHLVGPQAGLRWDLGGEKFKLTSIANFGAMANLDKIRIYAQNYGYPVGLNTVVEENHSHISPLVDLGIQAEIPLFSYVPLVKRIPVVRDAVTRVGYKHTWVFLMDRPADSITWGDPLPVIDTDRETWTLGAVNLGAEWKW